MGQENINPKNTPTTPHMTEVMILIATVTITMPTFLLSRKLHKEQQQ